MELQDIYDKLNDIETLLNNLDSIDYEAKNIKNVGNVVTDNDGNTLSVYYAKNASTIGGNTYEDFLQSMKDYMAPLIDDIKDSILDANDKKPLSASQIIDWKQLEYDNSLDFWYGTLATLDYTPSYVEILVKLEECSQKNGGDNGLITQIPPVGISINGFPLNKDGDVVNYSGWWIENNQIKLFLKKTDKEQWLGNCDKISYKILIWR